MLIHIGMIVAVNGVQNVDGNFEVSEYCLPGIPPQNDPLPSLNNDKYLKIKREREEKSVIII